MLIDVRTPEEWAQMMSRRSNPSAWRVRFATWTWFGTGERNPNFLTEATEGLDTETPCSFCAAAAPVPGAATVAEAAGFGTPTT